MKTWKKISWACCFECGSDDVAVHTELEKPELAYDGDRIRCDECGEYGWISADVETATAEWGAAHDEEQTK